MNSSRLLLALALVATSVAKLVSEHSPTCILPKWLWLTLAIAELATGIFLLLRSSVALYAILVALAMASLAASLVTDGAASCGCLGSLVEMTRWRHVMLTATFGALASVAWSDHVRRRRGAAAAGDQI